MRESRRVASARGEYRKSEVSCDRIVRSKIECRSKSNAQYHKNNNNKMHEMKTIEIAKYPSILCCAHFCVRWTCFVQLHRLHFRFLSRYGANLLRIRWRRKIVKVKIAFLSFSPFHQSASTATLITNDGKRRKHYRTTWISFNSTLVKIFQCLVK